MWGAIQYVTGGLTLVAFVAAAASWAYVAYIRARERTITKVTDKNHRAEAVQAVLQRYHIDTANLTPDHQYRLALEQMRAQQRRFVITASLVGLLCLVFFGLTAYAISETHDAAQGIPRQVQMRINAVLPGEESDAEVQLTAFVNGEPYTYPSLAGAHWVKFGPDVAPMTFDIPPSASYSLRLEGALRVHDRSQTLFDISDVPTEYRLASQTEERITTLPFSVPYRLYVVDPKKESHGEKLGAVVNVELFAKQH